MLFLRPKRLEEMPLLGLGDEELDVAGEDVPMHRTASASISTSIAMAAAVSSPPPSIAPRNPFLRRLWVARWKCLSEKGGCAFFSGRLAAKEVGNGRWRGRPRDASLDSRGKPRSESSWRRAVRVRVLDWYPARVY